MDTNEKDDLENLLKSPGWQRFQAWAKAEYRDQILSRLDAFGSDSDPAAALEILQAAGVRRAIERLLAWPKDRLARYETMTTTQNATVTTMHRGGA